MAALSHMANHLGDRGNRTLILTLMEEAQRDEQHMRSQAAFEATHPASLIISHGIESGEITRGIDPQDALVQLMGPVFYANVSARQRISHSEIERLVDEFLAHHAAAD